MSPVLKSGITKFLFLSIIVLFFYSIECISARFWSEFAGGKSLGQIVEGSSHCGSLKKVLKYIKKDNLKLF